MVVNNVQHYAIQQSWISSLNDDDNKLPSVANGDMTVEEDAKLRGQGLQFIIYLAEALNLPRLTWSTALVFYHRFFSRQSFVSHSHLEVSTVCLFLSCKVEETPKKITQVLQVARRAREVKKSEAGGEEGKWEGGNMDVKGQEFILMKDRTLLLERILLHTLSFDLNVVHPYKALVEEMKKFNNKATNNGLFRVNPQQQTDKTKVFTQEVFQLATGLVNDTYLTTICLCVEHDVVAKSCILLALEILGAEPFAGCKNWFEVLNFGNREKEGFQRVADKLEKANERLKGVVENEG